MANFAPWFLLLIALLGLGAVVVVGLVAWFLLSSRDKRAIAYGGPATAAAQHTRVATTIALIFFFAPTGLAILIGLPFISAGGGIGLIITVLVPTALFLGVTSVGEVAWPSPSGTVRTASLTPRTIRDVSARGLPWTLFASFAVLVAVATIGAMTAGPDGASLVREGPLWGSSHSPYPGYAYGIPALLAALTVIAGTYAVLRLIAARPAVAMVDPEFDIAIRRRSAARVLRIVQLPINLMSAALLIKMGEVVRRSVTNIDIPEAYSPQLEALGAVSVGAGIILIVMSLIIAVLPTPALPPSQVDSWEAVPPGSVEVR